MLLDGKYIRKGCYLLLAVDYRTLDIVAHLVCDSESEDNYTKLIDLVEACSYKISALISDGHTAITSLTIPKKLAFRKGGRNYPRPGIKPAKKPRARLEGTPHQWCVVHAQRELEQLIGKLERRENRKYQELRGLICNILFAKTLNLANKKKDHLVARSFETKSAIYKQVLSFILAHWTMLTLHHTLRVNGRKIPRDSNTVENVISYINSRLKTTRKLRTANSAIPICNLIVVNYRTKPLQNTKNKLKRGKSPLALTSGKNINFDWKIFIQKSTA